MMDNNEQKNDGAKAGAEIFTTAEKAQYEVFKTGDIPREKLAEWIRNDLRAIMSFTHSVLNDAEIFKAVVDVYHNRYIKLHENFKKNE